MKNLATLLLTLTCLLASLSASAQVEQIQNVTFKTTGQSIFNAGPGVNFGFTHYLLDDNGADASFFVETVNIDAMTDEPGLETGFEVLFKFGLDFDLYARFGMNSGTADIEYPVKIKFTKPDDHNYGCNEEVTIQTSYEVEDGYKMTIHDPKAEFAVGTQFSQGFFGGARACFLGNCSEAGENIGTGYDANGFYTGFKDANAGNFKNYMKKGDHDIFRISTDGGIQYPWNLSNLIPAPGFLAPTSLPLNTADYPEIENYANLEGTFDYPVKNLDGTDERIGHVLRDAGSHEFLNLEFDPIHFQEYLTRVPLSYSLNVGVFHFEFNIISIPLLMSTSTKHEFKFDPKIKMNLNLGQLLAWKEMNGATVVQQGYSQVVQNFTIGNDLNITMPLYGGVNITPSVKIENEFTTKLDLELESGVAFKLMEGSIKIDNIDANLPPLYEDSFAAFEEEFPFPTSTTNVVNKTFQMGGFNTATLNAIQLIPDVTPPVLVTKNIALPLPAAGGQAVINPQDVVENAYDAHGGTIRYISVTPNTFNCDDIGWHTVTVTIDDGRCNQTTGTAIVNVLDLTKPNVVCKTANAFLNSTGNASITPQDVYQSGTDNCGVVQLESVSPNTFTCDNIGFNLVVLTANDGKGNSNSCYATVTVIDNTPPVLNCQPTTAYLDENGEAEVAVADVLISSYDNCGTVNVASFGPSSFDCEDLGVVAVTVSTNDGHNNNTNCTVNVTVADNLPPTVVCNPKIAVYLNANGVAGITTADAFQSGADNCGIVNQQSIAPSNFTCADLGGVVVTLTVNDGHGNTGTCTSTVAVRDVISPAMSCRNVTLDLDANGKATLAPAQVNNGSFDNCGITVMSLDKTEFKCEDLGTNTGTLTGSDSEGNSSQCSATVTVRDVTSPVAKCKDFTVNLGVDGTYLLPTSAVDDGSFDNCSFTKVVTPNQFNCDKIGTHIVHLIATDGSGNSASCSARILVRDITPPNAVCNNPTIYLDDLGHGTLDIAQVDGGSSDACGIAWMTISQTEFDCSKIQGSPRNVTLAMADVHGNMSSCLSYVMVKDAIAPTAICQNTTVHLGANGMVTVYSEPLALNSYDNCSVWSYHPAAKVYTAADMGENDLVIKVKDWSQNAGTCVSLVTVMPYPGNNMGGPQQENRDEEEITAKTTMLELNVFPNPASGQAAVTFQMPLEKPFNLRAFDMSGRMVFSREGVGILGENTIPIALTGISEGVYLLDFQSEGLRVQKKLVVQR